MVTSERKQHKRSVSEVFGGELRHIHFKGSVCNFHQEWIAAPTYATVATPIQQMQIPALRFTAGLRAVVRAVQDQTPGTWSCSG